MSSRAGARFWKEPVLAALAAILFLLALVRREWIEALPLRARTEFAS